MSRPRRQGEGALSDAIREALALEGVLLFRNSQAVMRRGARVYRGGLGNGSADLIGVVQVTAWARSDDDDCTQFEKIGLGRFMALEVKRPGEDAEPHQAAWLAAIRDAGGFACVVHSVSEARAAVVRARVGLCE